MLACHLYCANSPRQEMMLPRELWSHILMFSTESHRKQLSLVSCDLQQASRQLLWRKPSFRGKLDDLQLQQLASMDLPVRQLRHSQLTAFSANALQQGREAQRAVKCTVRYLSQAFQLTSFVVDDGDSNLLDFVQLWHTLKQLPVTHIHTDSLDIDTDELVDLLVDCKRTPTLSIGRVFHDRLSNQEWRKLVNFPVDRIFASEFPAAQVPAQVPIHLNKHYISEEQSASLHQTQQALLEYCNLIGQISPPPVYTLLWSWSESIWALKKVAEKIKITDVIFSDTDPSTDVFAFTEALQAHKQTPFLVVHEWLALYQLEALLQFPCRLFTQRLHLTKDTVGDFIELVLMSWVHTDTSTLMINNSTGVFAQQHLSKLEIAGIRYSILH